MDTVDLLIVNCIQNFAILLFVLYPWLIILMISTVAKHIPRFLLFLIYVVIMVTYTIGLVLLGYVISRGIPFDVNFYTYNQKEAVNTVFIMFTSNIPILVGASILFIIFLVVGYRSFVCIYLRVKSVIDWSKSWYMIILVVVSCLVFTYLFLAVILDLVDLRSINNSQIADEYYRYYYDRLENNVNSEIEIDKDVVDENLPNIIMLHLESVNANYVNESTTPRFVEAFTSKGIYFPYVQGASVQTIRAQEVAFCSIPPSLGESIPQSEFDSSKLNCLPKILKQHGYETLYFHHGSKNTISLLNEFTEAIGFDEIHASDITQLGDPYLSWGYRDDVFIERVVGYLDERYAGKDQKYFAYISVGSINHIPFNLPKGMLDNDSFTYTKPVSVDQSTLLDKYLVTLGLQDQVFGDLYDWYERTNKEDNTILFAFGDHSWPLGEHNNVYNEYGYWQENFVTIAGIISPKGLSNQINIGDFQTYVSQEDFAPTILDLIGLDRSHMTGESILNYYGLAKRPDCIISIQPYTKSALSLLDYPMKYIYMFEEDKVVSFNIHTDSQEENPIYEGEITNDYKRIYLSCLN